MYVKTANIMLRFLIAHLNHKKTRKCQCKKRLKRSIDTFVGRANHDSCQNSNQMWIPKPTNDDSSCSPFDTNLFVHHSPFVGWFGNIVLVHKWFMSTVCLSSASSFTFAYQPNKTIESTQPPDSTEIGRATLPLWSPDNSWSDQRQIERSSRSKRLGRCGAD